jgi:hypothetical protein
MAVTNAVSSVIIVGAILAALGEVIGRDPVTGFDLVRLPDGRRVRIVELRAGAEGVGLAMRTEWIGTAEQP